MKELLTQLLKNLKTNKTKSSILNFLLVVFSFLVLVYPLSYGIVDLQGTIVFGFLIYTIYITGKKTKLFTKLKIKEKYYLAIILFFAIFTRIGIVILLNSSITQLSDFYSAIENAKTLTFNTDYYRVFTHWVMYPAIVHYVMEIFGKSECVALMTNAVILIVNSVLLYQLSKKIFSDKKLSFIVSMMYVIWPGNILYTVIFTQEHLGQTLLLLSLIFFLNTNIQEKKKFIYAGLMGSTLALSTFFKNFAPVFIIASIIYYIMNCLKINNKELKKYFLEKIIIIVIIFITFTISQFGAYKYLDHLIGVPVARNITPCYLNVGLRGTGIWDADNYGMYFNTLRKNDYDYDKTNDEILTGLIESLKEPNNNVIEKKFFENKANILFKGDAAKIYWVKESILATSTDNKEKVEKYAEEMTLFNNDFFVILTILSIIGIIQMVKKQNLSYFVIYLIFFGCFLLLILVEAQNRYMYSIQPLLCIMATIGIETIIEKSKTNEKVSRINKNKALD